YLIYSWSLLHDHDVDLRNNYADASLVQRLYGHPETDPHAYDYRRDGRLVSDHQIGLPLLITPGVPAGGRRRAAIELDMLGAVLALGLGVALVFRMVRANTAASAAPRQGRAPEAFPMVAPVLSVALLMITFSRWYGSVLPGAPYHFPGVVNEARPAADVSTLY